MRSSYPLVAGGRLSIPAERVPSCTTCILAAQKHALRCNRCVGELSLLLVLHHVRVQSAANMFPPATHARSLSVAGPRSSTPCARPRPVTSAAAPRGRPLEAVERVAWECNAALGGCGYAVLDGSFRLVLADWRHNHEGATVGGKVKGRRVEPRRAACLA